MNFEISGDSTVLIPNDFNDTIYQIDKNGSINQFVIFNLGKNIIPKDILNNRKTFIEYQEKYFTDISTTVFPTVIFVGFKIHGESLFGSFNRNTEGFSLINNLDTIAFGIMNDIDGGPPLSFEFSNHYNTAYKLLQPFEIIRLRDIGYFSKLTFLNSKKHSQFLSLVESISINDNPIIMISHMKKR